MKHPTHCCQKCGDNIGWLGRWVFPFLHSCQKRTDAKMVFMPLPKWKWDVFGDGSLTVLSPTLEPTIYRRLISGLVLGSKWTRINQEAK